MPIKFFIRGLWVFVLCLTAWTGQATSFTSKDQAFTLDMPSGWKEITPLPQGYALSIKKDAARIDIKTISCSTETCIENKINDDLADIKRKKMQVIGNSYTGEDIKRIEFSTGEPFFYISFFTPKEDFACGYFLINHHAYSILARNLTYAETDLIFSFISPQMQSKKETPEDTPSLEMDLTDPRAYDTASVPTIAEETVAAPDESSAQIEPVSKSKAASFAFPWAHVRKKLAQLHTDTFLSQHMPPYIRQLGHGFDALIAIGFLYLLFLLGTLLLRVCIRTAPLLPAANPNSLYPIFFQRLYGTPSLIFRAKDNQGNILISLSSRWDSLFLLTGLFLILSTCVLMAAAGLAEKGHWLPLSAFTYSTLYSICSLLVPLGLIIFLCGIVWSQLILREINLFDRKGKKAAVVLQKGFGLTTERYEIYFARSKEVLTATRKRFSLRRSWQLFNPEGHLLAHVRETSAGKAILRKLLGHTWGFLRADYSITGQMDCSGEIKNAHGAFNRFICHLDKPQAINARDMLVLSLLINIRDKDKWYPWFN